MKIVAATALLAFAKLAAAGQVSNDLSLSNENIRDADSVLKDHAGPIVHQPEDALTDECAAKTEDLSACFDKNGETDGADCWEECVIPASENPESCDAFCLKVEQCRRNKCSSGSACGSHYYDVLNCALDMEEGEKCTCTGAWNLEHPNADAANKETIAVEDVTGDDSSATSPEEELAPDDESVPEECVTPLQDLSDCFDNNEEADGASCWEDCVLPAFHSTSSNEGFCTDIEQCRSKKCSSGPACTAQYYGVLDCVMATAESKKGYTCAGSWNIEERESAVEDVAEEGIPEECMTLTQDLSNCFDNNKEADGADCWEECVIPAFDSADSNEGFCTDIEQCRSKKCSSGSVCATHYYGVLDCVMAATEGPKKGYTCAESRNIEERKTAVEDVTEEGIPEECMTLTKDLSNCFDNNEETDGSGCWEDCVIPAWDSAGSNEDFCTDIEQCRSKKCSSGSACAAQYYGVLDCIMATAESKKEYTCAESWNIEERETAVEDVTEEGIPEECMTLTQDLSNCFDDNEEDDGADCWEECVIPAFDSADSNEGFCTDIEQCRSKKCSSGTACAAHYYGVLDCVMAATEGPKKGYTCTAPASETCAME